MANVNAVFKLVAENGLADNEGYRLGFLESTTKAAQNDTVTVTNASAIKWVGLQIVATGAAEAHTIAANVITCTSATTGAVKGLAWFKA